MTRATVSVYTNIEGRSALWTSEVHRIPCRVVFDEPLHVTYRSLVEAFYRLRQVCEIHQPGNWPHAIALAREPRDSEFARRYYEAVIALLQHWGVEPTDLPKLGLDLRPYMLTPADHAPLMIAVRDRWTIQP